MGGMDGKSVWGMVAGAALLGWTIGTHDTAAKYQEKLDFITHEYCDLRDRVGLAPTEADLELARLLEEAGRTVHRICR